MMTNKIHLRYLISFLLLFPATACWAQPRTIELQFVNMLTEEPINGSQVNVLLGDSTHVFFTDTFGEVSFQSGPTDTIDYELFVFDHLMDTGKVIGNEESKLIMVSLQIRLEEVLIAEDREPLIKESFGGIYERNSGHWSKTQFPVLGLDRAIEGVQMTDGSTASFYNILQIER